MDTKKSGGRGTQIAQIGQISEIKDGETGRGRDARATGLLEAIGVIVVRMLITCLLLLSMGAVGPTSRPAGVGDAVWGRMVAADRKAAGVRDLTARFEQKKVTPLLKKPLVSSGVVRIRGAVMRWDTERPEASVLRTDEKDVRIYYPSEKTEEVYALRDRLAALAASPLPRLDVLTEHFAVAADDSAEGGDGLALKLTPTDAAVKEHVGSVRVVVDEGTGTVSRLELVDTDGDRTVVTFTDVRVNTGVSDEALRLDVPAGTKVTRPLGALE